MSQNFCYFYSLPLPSFLCLFLPFLKDGWAGCISNWIGLLWNFYPPLINIIISVSKLWIFLFREYLPMGGSVKMVEETLKLAYGDNSEFIKDKRIAAVQSLSGTGACRLFADFQKRFHPDSQIYIPVPTWSKWVLLLPCSIPSQSNIWYLFLFF